MPTRINQDRLMELMVGELGAKSATWPRRGDKKVRGELVASAGDRVTMQFVYPISGRPMKNWTPVPPSQSNPEGGQVFGKKTRREADAILVNNGLIVVGKISETGTDDPRGCPRTIPFYDIELFKVGGVEYEIIR